MTAVAEDAASQRPWRFVTLDVFTDRRFGGNPLAVFPHAAGLDDATMQALAGEFNLSETTFVLPPNDPRHTARVRIFTPQAEVAFAGHPNLGTAWVLAQEGLDRDGVLVFEGGGGLVRIDVERDGGRLVACRVSAPRMLTLGEAPSGADLARCAGLDATDIVATRVASVGLDCVCAQVPEAALARAAPDAAAFRALADRWLGRGSRFMLCLYAREGERLHGRVFGPLYGVTEDPACGSATGALVAMLLHDDGGPANRMTMAMGAEMGRPSVLHCGAERGPGGIRAWIGGSCVEMLRGEVVL